MKDQIKICKNCGQKFVVSRCEQKFFSRLPTQEDLTLCYKCRLEEKLKNKPRKNI